MSDGIAVEQATLNEGEEHLKAPPLLSAEPPTAQAVSGEVHPDEERLSPP
jgi:hypothetical protein